MSVDIHYSCPNASICVYESCVTFICSAWFRSVKLKNPRRLREWQKQNPLSVWRKGRVTQIRGTEILTPGTPTLSWGSPPSLSLRKDGPEVDPTKDQDHIDLAEATTSGDRGQSQPRGVSLKCTLIMTRGRSRVRSPGQEARVTSSPSLWSSCSRSAAPASPASSGPARSSAPAPR